MADSRFVVLMVKATQDDVSCRRCTSSGLDRRRLSEAEARREIEKVYKGWQCGCRKSPESRIEVHVQGPTLEYLIVCVGCASELTGLPKEELTPPELRVQAPT